MKVLAINPGMNTHWRTLADGPVRSYGMSQIKQTVHLSVEGPRGVVYQVEVSKAELLKLGEYLQERK